MSRVETPLRAPIASKPISLGWIGLGLGGVLAVVHVAFRIWSCSFCVLLADALLLGLTLGGPFLFWLVHLWFQFSRRADQFKRLYRSSVVVGGIALVTFCSTCVPGTLAVKALGISRFVMSDGAAVRIYQRHKDDFRRLETAWIASASEESLESLAKEIGDKVGCLRTGIGGSEADVYAVFVLAEDAPSMGVPESVDIYFHPRTSAPAIDVEDGSGSSDPSFQRLLVDGNWMVARSW